ncbi:MAG TPA: hypothetical protein PLJ21_08230 [Pseudobdellovibrionaceae bacterium]|nr:hypothetical protein [Pseudobdellovibrionaceae bacterium]
MKIFNELILTSTLLLLFTACGQPANDNNLAKEALNKTVQHKESTLTPLAGHYEGTLINTTTNEEQIIVFEIIPTIMIVQNPGQNDVTEMPTLGGNINIIINNADQKDIIPVAQFTMAKFTPETGNLRLNGSIQSGTSLGSILNTFDGQVSGHRITGTLFNSTRGNLGTVNVQKLF